MKNIKYILKAAIIIGIALALVMPGAATLNNENALIFDGQTPTIKPLGMAGGWVEQASNFWDPSRGVRYLHAVDENISWAVGYDGSGANEYKTWFTKTTNGGDEWLADLVINTDNYGLGNICGLDGDTAWAAVFYNGEQDENCGIYKTINGGDTWEHQFEGPYSFANNVWFFDENEGVALGDQADDYFEIWTSDDGGDTWTRVPEENFSGHAVVPGEFGWTGCMEAVGDNTIIFGTHAPEGYAFISHDRGHTWFGSFTGCAGTGQNPGVNDLAFKDPDHGLAAHDNGATYDLYTTSDGGANWEQIMPSGTAYASGLSYVPGTDNMYISTGAATGTSGASFSLDGGYTWTDYTEVAGIQLLSCDFVEGVIGWAGAFNTDEETGGMYRYTPPEQPEPDLYCVGSLSWTDVKPGSTVTDTFKVQNVGDPGSLLDWEVTEWPEDWGTWTFTPSSGEDLTPEDGSVTVEVEVVAPEEKNEEFSGEVKVVNLEDPDDFELIDISLATPRNKAFNILLQFLNFLEQHPNLFPIIRHLLGL